MLGKKKTGILAILAIVILLVSLLFANNQQKEIHFYASLSDVKETDIQDLPESIKKEVNGNGSIKLLKLGVDYKNNSEVHHVQLEIDFNPIANQINTYDLSLVDLKNSGIYVKEQDITNMNLITMVNETEHADEVIGKASCELSLYNEKEEFIESKTYLLKDFI